MANNNHPQSPHQWNQTPNYSQTTQQTYQKQNHQYISPNYPNSLSTGKIDQGGQGYVTRGYDQEFKQRNRTMYNSSMDFGGSGSSNQNLNSLGRQVGESANFKEQYQQQRQGKFNNQEKYTSQFNKYSDTVGKDPKMASSAIFPNNNTNSADFHRFPAFDLGVNNQTNQSPPQSITENNQTYSSNNVSNGAKTNYSETPQQRKQKQLMEIKRQLDEINKKMQDQANKSKNLSSQNQKNDLRPTRTPVISQSMIIESNNPSTNNSFGYGYNQPKQTLGNAGLSIDQLYAQKKSNETPRTSLYVDSSFKNNISADLPQYKTEQKHKSNQQQTTFKKYEQTIITPKQYETSNSKQQNYQFQNKNSNYSQNPIQTQKYNPISSPNHSNNNYNYGTYDQKYSVNVNTNNASNQVKQVNSPVYSSNENNGHNYGKINEGESTGFKKKRENVVYDPISSDMDQGGFKKSYAVGQNVNMKKPVYPEIQSPTVSSSTSASNSPFKQTSTHDYIDESIPVPEKVNFKVTDFAVGKKMGKGQFGEVMLVRHKLTGWVCGLKVMQKKQIKEEDYAGQIARQLSIQFYLTHRNIATLYGYFEDEKNVYLLVQFCTGGQLLEKLRGERRMNQKDVSVIIKQVCQGVDYIHKQLIIHRDIKPQNILFNFGVVKISDFGWAVYRGFGMRKTASGSPLYYPPQIVKGESYDDKIDIWNIGMMTYECILGKIPFRVYTEMDLGRIVSDEITFPSWVDVTDEAKDFILKTMKKKGDQRMQIRQMLRHPFITKHQDVELNASILQQFKRVLA